MTDYTTPSHVVTGTDISSSAYNAQALDNISHHETAVHVTKINADAVSHAQGTLVKLSTTAGQVQRTTAAGTAGPLGVAIASSAVASGAAGDYGFGGMASVLCTGAVAVGDQLQSSAAAGHAVVGGTNAFGIAHATQASGSGLVLVELINPIGSASLASHDHTGAGDGGTLTAPVHDSYDIFNEVSVPSAPAASTTRLYAYDKSGTTELAYKNEAGTVRDLSLAGTSVDHNHTAVGDGGVLDSPRFTDDLKTSAGAVFAQLVGTAGVAIGSAANATTDTSPYLYITTSAGAPTGVPTAATGRVAVHYDTTNKRLYVYDTGTSAWLYLPIGTQSANQVLAGPSSGGAAQAAYRALVYADIPIIAFSATGSPTLDQTHNTSTFTAITNASATLTTHGGLVVVVWDALFTVDNASNTMNWQIKRDSSVLRSSGNHGPYGTASWRFDACWVVYDTPTAASHTYSVEWKSNDNSTNIRLPDGSLHVFELKTA